MNHSNVETKVRVIMVANKLDVTGISTVIMNYCSHMDFSKLEITIAAGKPIADIHNDTCKQLGIRLFELPNRKQNCKQYYKALNHILTKEQFDVIHIHGNSATMTVELFLGWIHGIKVRIPHSHNTTCTNMKLHKLLHPLFDLLYTHAFACGQKAGEWLYGDNPFYIIQNGFDMERFKFSQEIRDEIRKQKNLENAFIIGHIGRFNEQKNQIFLIKVFEKYADNHTNAVLILVGIGPNLEVTKEIAKRSPYGDRIVFWGETNRPEEVYSIMDVFVLPSRYEGLPVVLMEAECNGLYCIISDKVTDEMNIDEHIISCSLDDSPTIWCNAIEKIPVIDRDTFYVENRNALDKFNIESGVRYLEKLYMTFVDEKR